MSVPEYSKRSAGGNPKGNRRSDTGLKKASSSHHYPPEDTEEAWGATLDENGCLSLEQILLCFRAPVTEQHAWAIIYETLKTLHNLLLELEHQQSRPPLLSVTSPEDILIHQSGRVSPETFLRRSDRKSPSRQKPSPGKSKSSLMIESEDLAVCDVGIVIYSALDHGLTLEQERHLSPELERILDQMMMTSAASDSRSRGEAVVGRDRGAGSKAGPEVDEGIEPDHNFSEDQQAPLGHDKPSQIIRRSGLCSRIMQECRSKLMGSSDGDAHYRAVCRALVSEAVELSTFVEKVSKHEMEMGDMVDEIQLQDWAKLWVQVLKDLRTGVKLKQVSATLTPVEFELTPYEILMDDIRSKKYSLNRVMVDGELPPRIKRDAHNIILEFIRSRPPLRPAADRELPPPMRKESTPVELLMESIRNSSARSSLRKTKGPATKSLRARLGYEERSRCGTEFGTGDDEAANSYKRKVTLDPSMVDNLLNFSDDDQSDLEDAAAAAAAASGRQDLSSTRRRQDDPDGPSPSKGFRRRRRHSLTVCETPTAAPADEPRFPLVSNLPQVSDAKVEDACSSSSSSTGCKGKQRLVLLAPQISVSSSATMSDGTDEGSEDEDGSSSASGPSSGSSTPNNQRFNNNPFVRARSGAASKATQQPQPPRHVEVEDRYNLNTPQMHANLQAEFLRSEHWATALQTLDLTLDEVVHIRSVLTKADLESLPLDGTLKDDVEKGKVCFLCMKTRFGFFVRGCTCQMCQQKICNKCSTKMNIPMNHFSATPVFALEPATPVAERGCGTRPAQEGSWWGWSSSSGSVTDLSATFFAGGGMGCWNRSPSPQVGCSAPNSPMLSSSRRAAAGGGRGDRLSFRSTATMTSSLTSFHNAAGMEDEDEYSSCGFKGPSGPGSLPSGIEDNTSRCSLRRDSKVNKPAAGGRKMLTICVDCKEMVLQVIRAQHTAQRMKLAKSLFLGLD